MKEHQITNIKLSASHDLGHGGSAYYYELTAVEDVYKISLSTSSSIYPGPGSPFKEPLNLDYEDTSVELKKDSQQVKEFLRKLSKEFNVFELTDFRTLNFLHPSFYTFTFQDSTGAEHSFEYMIECSNHLDKKYEMLVKTFNEFFEMDRIASQFYEKRQAAIEQFREKQRLAEKSWWKFW